MPFPLAVYRRLLRDLAEAFRRSTEETSRWLGHRVRIIDGSSFSMPDTDELRAKFGQPSGQRRGCGFPVAKFVALFDLATGLLLRVEEAPLRSHDMSRAAAASAGLRPGARWMAARADAERVVALSKPEKPPGWISAEDYAALPAELAVRQVRYRVPVPGYRVREVVLMTTLLDAAAYPASALADLYHRRWQIELNFRHLKITMSMDILKCKTVDGVLKELTVFAMVYNLVRSVMVASARARGVEAERLSLIDAVRWLVGSEGDEDLTVIFVVPSRPGKVEPRVVKHRPKQYPRMTGPRAELRKQLMEEGLAA